jgi:hypothetical protein
VVEFPIPRQRVYHGLFYGNHHDAVKHLSADTNVRINVPDTHPSTHHQISLEGAADNVFRALTKFAQVITNQDYAMPRPHATTGASKESCLSPLVFRDGLFELTVKIPSHIVGVLLVRRSTDPNVIHQIRQLTHTSIIKLETPADSPEKSGDESSPTAPEIEAEMEEETTDETLTGTGPPRYNPRGYEIFAVRGSKEADVTLASSVIARILDGEKIYGVMTELKALKERKREPGDFFSRGGRGSGRVGRGGRGGYYGASRGGYSTNHPTRGEGDGLSRGLEEGSEQHQRVGEPAGESEAEGSRGGDPVEEGDHEAGGQEGESEGEGRGRGGRGGRGAGRTSRGGRSGRGGGRVRLERGRGRGRRSSSFGEE